MRVLVLGGYGLIGTAIVRRLVAAGNEVAGLGRSVEGARRRTPEVRWIAADLHEMQSPEAWMAHLEGIEAVVNAAGALQDGLRDDLALVQDQAVRALIEACGQANVRKVVQISAPGASQTAATAFMRTKGLADAALVASGLDWVILRPGLVLSPTAYGATALIRALASFPLVMPMMNTDARLQTVHVEDVAEAVLATLDGRVPRRQTYDLVEEQAHRLGAVVEAFRAWHGLPPARPVRIPRALGRLLFLMGDALGLLGWRTPLRSTALHEIEAGIIGDPGPWRQATGRALAPFSESLRRLPSTVQERWYGRLWLLKPVIIATLSLFWVLTGVITLAKLEAASRHLEAAGVGSVMASLGALLGALLDILLGALVLVRSMVAAAALGMAAVSLLYLMIGTAFASHLWADPLGPYLKVLPGLVLALVAAAIAEER